MSPRAEAWLIGAALTIAGVGMTLIAPPVPRLLWNASTSAPKGLYWVMPGAMPKRGDMVIAWPPRRWRHFAAIRHYLPLGVPLVKRVTALFGDRICAKGSSLFVNGRMLAHRLARDPYGRLLPWWRGCITLARGELLLLNSPANSFDGRYFGPTDPADIVGKANLLWRD